SVANQVVAEDSKDAFLGADKDRLLKYEIIKARYSDNFTKAEVVVLTRRNWLMQGRRVVVPMPVTTFWKVVGGEWYWYAPPATGTKNSPFGTMKAGEGDGNSGGASGVPVDMNAAGMAILDQVKVDKTAVELSSYQAASATVTISNAMQGKVALRADTDIGIPGFILKLEKTELSAGESCKLLLSMDPENQTAKPAVTVRLWVQPLNKMIPIRVTFAIPPEIERQIPKGR
ncbi:MAG: hypothetical protein ABI165_12655, partial [Bryobacteraceae bacterium]